MKNIFLRLFKKISLHKKSGKPLVSPNLDIALLKSVRKQPYPRVHQIRHFKRFLTKGEKMVYRIAVVCFFIGFFWLGYEYFINHTVGVPTNGGEYVEAIVGAPVLINPLFSSINDVDKDIARLVYSGLMKVNQEGKIVPDLAENISLSEDKKTYTLHLKKNVVWHDGEAFTSKDVLFTFETIQNRAVNSPLLLSFQGVKVSALDEYTVQFILPEIYTLFPSSLTVGILPEHVWGEIPVEQIRLARINLQPVGTGPFKFLKLVSDKTGFISEYSLERFDRFYSEAPYIDKFSFRFFASYDGDDSNSAAIQALLEQKVDGVNFVPVNLLEKVDKKHLVVYNVPIPQYTALFFNQKNNVFLEDKNLRIALTQALDKQKIVKDTLKGDATVNHGPILEGAPGYTATSSNFEYSVDDANKKLDALYSRISVDDLLAKRKIELEKSWIDLQEVSSSTPSSTVSSSSTQNQMPTSSDDMQAFVKQTLDAEFSTAQTFFRKTKKDEIVTLDLVTVDTPEYHKAAEIIAGFWQEVGIKVNIEYVNAKSLSRDVLRERKYDVLLYGVLLGSDPDQYPFWHSSQIAFPGLNLSQYGNRAVDDILRKIRETENSEEIANLYRQFEQKILEDVPAIFLYTPYYHFSIGDTVKGIDLDRITEPSDRFANVSSWYIKTKATWGKK